MLAVCLIRVRGAAYVDISKSNRGSNVNPLFKFTCGEIGLTNYSYNITMILITISLSNQFPFRFC